MRITHRNCLKGLYKLRFFSFLISFFLLSTLSAQEFPSYPDSDFSTYYHQKASQYAVLPHQTGQIVFLGNSITDGGSWAELFQDPNIINRGISGDVTKGVLNRLQNVVKRKPSKLFLLISTNDLARGVSTDKILQNIFKIVKLTQAHSPLTKIYIQSIFPVNKKPGKFGSHTKNGKRIVQLNQKLKTASDNLGYIFIDVHSALSNSKGHLNLNYTNDGLHLLGAGYMQWKHVLFPYVYDLNTKPSIVPLPHELEWKNEQFSLYKNPPIYLADATLKPEAQFLKSYLNQLGISSSITTKKPQQKAYITLKINRIKAPLFKDEAYLLNVSKDKIEIIANTNHGIFNGIQSLRQLMRDGVIVDGVQIKDWPAFKWRGYMIDVGRNYQSMAQIKAQIDEMAHYKLNVFHFHLTEDIAWRLQIEHYPQLTAPEHMTRDKGQYYTIAQIKDLQAYCKARHITLVPEIDMPGHSAAFKRAMGVDMQSDEGMAYLKTILREIDSTYQFPYLHIGADEVAIHNKKFISTMVNFLEDLDVKTIGWYPGGNYDARTIHQLWGSKKIDTTSQSQYIDSRTLYINHKDPLSGVVSIFNRQLGDVNHGTSQILGGELCLWNDNRAANEKDILEMNFAYPAILTFAERAWIGGGHKETSTVIGKKSSERYRVFKNFENRLLDQKKLFFKDKSFPYAAQADITWKLYGPFENEGNLKAEFWPEKAPQKLATTDPTLTVTGGTIWLRHFFNPAIKGNLDNPQPNTTWYAMRKIYSPSDQIGHFWIGFFNPSRSYVVATPQLGTWDNRQSKVWVNGQEILPPQWTYPGRDNSTENPLVDESYEYRQPTAIHLSKGWNTVLIKAPVGSFAGKDWQHKVKWEFTFVQVNK